MKKVVLLDVPTYQKLMEKKSVLIAQNGNNVTFSEVIERLLT